MNSIPLVSMAELPKLLANLLQEQSSKLIDKIVLSQQFLSDKFDDVSGQIRKLKLEVNTLRAENDHLKRSLSLLTDKTNSVSKAVHRQEVEIDNRLKTEITSNIVVLGLPRVPNEDTTDLVMKTCATMDFKLDKSSIVSCSRISSNKNFNNPIRITFRNMQSKENLKIAKKKFGPLSLAMIQGVRWPGDWSKKVVIRDELSPLSMELLQDLKKHQTVLKARYIWPGRDGSVLIKFKQESKPIIIRSRSDLRNLLMDAKCQ